MHDATNDYAISGDNGILDIDMLLLRWLGQGFHSRELAKRGKWLLELPIGFCHLDMVVRNTSRESNLFKIQCSWC